MSVSKEKLPAIGIGAAGSEGPLQIHERCSRPLGDPPDSTVRHGVESRFPLWRVGHQQELRPPVSGSLHHLLEIAAQGIGPFHPFDFRVAGEPQLERLVAEDSRILSDPAPTIAVSELADSSVNFVCRPWCATADYWTVYFEITRKVKEEFDKANLEIPFPQMDVHVHKINAA